MQEGSLGSLLAILHSQESGIEILSELFAAGLTDDGVEVIALEDSPPLLDLGTQTFGHDC